MYPTYEPNSFAHSILALVFYLIMAGIVIYSLVALYALMRYGRSKLLTITVSIIYLVICGGLYLAAITNLNNIRL